MHTLPFQLFYNYAEISIYLFRANGINKDRSPNISQQTAEYALATLITNSSL